MPKPQGQRVPISAFVDANHAGNKVTRCLHTGIIIYVQNAPILHQRPENVNVQLICHILQQFCLNFVTRVCQFIIFFSLPNLGSKIKHIVANSLNVDTDKNLLSETISCIQFV
jgi:hypothetical protein